MIGRQRLRLACGAACALASGSLAALFSSTSWVPYVLGCVAVLTALNVVARMLRCPPALIPMLDFVALLLYLCTVFGSGQFAGIVPTEATLLSLRDGLRAASTDIAQLTAPAPPHAGLVLVTVAAFGAVTAAVDAIAVGLRRPALAGLPLLVTLIVPAMVSPNGVGWLGFVLTALGYLGILLADDRDRAVRWGPRLTDRPDPAAAAERSGTEAASWRRLRSIGPGTALVAVVLAALIPLLVPAIGIGGLARATGGSGIGLGGDGGASRTARVIDPATELRGQLARSDPIELFRLTTNSTDYYLRLTTLDTFRANRGWSQSRLTATARQRVSAGLPNPLRGKNTPTRKVTAKVQMTGLATSQYLPIYPEPTGIKVNGDWRYVPRSGTVFSTRTNTQNLTYTVTGAEPKDSPQLTAQLQRAPALSADDPITIAEGRIAPEPKIQPIVNKIVAGKTSQYAKTLAIYQYFADPANGFQYSLQTRAGSSGDQLLDFLRNKQGYCEQYASAMAAMERLAGVPARVAVGYTTGSPVGNYRSVTTDDAHAWVEVYFHGTGWTTWDPTPPSGNGRATAASYTSPPVANTGNGGQTGASTAPSAQPTPSPSLTAPQSEVPKDYASGSAQSPANSGGPGVATYVWALLAVVVVLMLLLPALIRPHRRRRRLRAAGGRDPTTSAHAAWAEVADTASDLGIGVSAGESVRAVAERLSRRPGLPTDAAGLVVAVARAEERARYARFSTADTSALDLADAVRAISRGLVATVPTSTRIKARCAPASVIAGRLPAGRRAAVAAGSTVLHPDRDVRSEHLGPEDRDDSAYRPPWDRSGV